MNLRSFKNLGAVSIIALSTAMNAGSAWAVANGSPTTVTINATVLNSFTVTKTTLDFGTIGVHNFTGDVAQGVLSGTCTASCGLTMTQGSGSATLGTQARLATAAANGATPAIITVVGLGSTVVNVHYDTLVDLTNGGNKIVLHEIRDNLNALIVGDAGTSGTQGFLNATPANQDGSATTDSTGNLKFRIGGTIKTDTSVTGNPPSGTYSGSFNITLSY